MTDPAANEPLDFQRAQFDAPPPALTCDRCKQPLVASYFSINGKGVCAACLERAKQQQRGSLLKALFFGSSLGLAGAVLFGVVAALWEPWGFFTIIIGIAVGIAVRTGAGGNRGQSYRALAVVIAWVSMSLFYVPLFMQEVSLAGAVLSALRLPFIFILQREAITILIFAFGLWEAYRFSAPRPFVVEGPFEPSTAKP